MEKLVNQSEIIKLGYKLDKGCYVKGRSRYIFCPGCSKWNETRLQPEKDTHKLSLPCNWCNVTIVQII